LGINANEFAKKLEYKRSQTIYDIVSDKVKPSFDFFQKLENSEYSELFNFRWIIGGKGEMLKQDTIITPMNINRKTKDGIIENQEVPYYDFSAAAGLQELFDSGTPHKVLQTIKIPNLPKCDGAINVTGDSMYPLLKSGDIILYKQITVDDIFFGEMYLLSILTKGHEEYVTVKYVQKSDLGKEYVKLVSQNQHHQPKDFKVNEISAIAIVKASVRFNTMF
jgi:phage repressor protein C with HTH and peptisase S24 domain